MTLFSDDNGGRFLASCLREGQQQWIREQFLRVSTLVRLPSAGPAVGEKGKSADSTAESLAKQVRKGAIFMSGR